MFPLSVLAHTIIVISQFDASLRKEYDEAVEAVPHLVKLETPVIRFLRREDFHTIQASRRLVLYWKYRKQVFAERWLLPMTLTGNGALSMSAIELLRSCHFTVVRHPKPLIVIDTSRTHRPVAQDTLEWTFYYNTVITEEIDQTVGTTIIQIVREGDHPQALPGLAEILDTAIPSKTAGFFLLPTLEPAKALLREYLVYQASRLSEQNVGYAPPLLLADSIAGRLQLLESSLGIPPESVPTSIGGYHTDDAFHNWIRVRISIEDAMSSAPITANNALASWHAPRAASATNIDNHHVVVDASATDDSAATTTNNNDTAIVVRKSKDRVRPNMRLQTLQEVWVERRQENQRCKAENRRLMAYLAEARCIVAEYKNKEASSEE